MIRVKIGNKFVGEGEPTFIIFEAGATFTNLKEAKKLAKAAAESGADAIKFQVLDADSMTSDKTLTINYLTSSGQKTGNIYEILKKRELKDSEWKELKEYCDEIGIIFFSTADCPKNIDMLIKLGTAAIKINAGDVNHYYLIDYASKKGITIMLDGRAKYEELERGVEICEKNGNKNIIIMHCPSGYPVRNDGVNLSVISSLKRIYKYPIGFADHSREKLMNYAALTMGANLLEKALTLDKNTEAIKHIMSLEPNEAKEFVKEIRAIEEAIGSFRIMFGREVDEISRRSIMSQRNIKKGETMTIKDIEFKRPGGRGISCAYYEKVLGKKAKKDVPKNTFVNFEMIE